MTSLRQPQDSYEQFTEQDGGDASALEAQQNKAARVYQDSEWILIFLVHLGIMGVIAGMWGGDTVDFFRDIQANAEDNAEEVDQKTQDSAAAVLRSALPYVGIGIGVALGWAVFWVSLIQRYAENLIWIALLSSPVIFGIIALFMMMQSAVAGLLALIPFAVTAFYAYWIITYQRFRIEFATLMLEAVAEVVRFNPGTWITAMLSGLPSIVWQCAWFFVAASTFVHYKDSVETYPCTNPRTGAEELCAQAPASLYLAIFFLLVSNYWVIQVIINVVHVTTAGVVGEWYFQGRDRMSASPTTNSLKRAMTTSFGSICLGSLLVAIVQAIREIAEQARRNHEGNLVCMVIFCCFACIMSWIEYLIELFNHWAFVQVAIYGTDFKTAARNTFQLVQSKGLTGLVNMNLTGNASALGVIVGAILTAAVVALTSFPFLLTGPMHNESLSEDIKSAYHAAFTIVIVMGFVFGILFTSAVTKTVTSGVTAFFVCWAENPAVLESTNPRLHEAFASISEKYLQDQREATQAEAIGGGVNNMQRR
mmetsp:Transcript_10428/g.28392  ORF Transcript_10428/g.28392 Transcript_10428/m.28392 type:complete len:536 (-) Transcript_10428:646-2253(-)